MSQLSPDPHRSKCVANAQVIHGAMVAAADLLALIYGERALI
jgi:hypothetical protein